MEAVLAVYCGRIFRTTFEKPCDFREKRDVADWELLDTRSTAHPLETGGTFDSKHAVVGNKKKTHLERSERYEPAEPIGGG